MKEPYICVIRKLQKGSKVVDSGIKLVYKRKTKEPVRRSAFLELVEGYCAKNGKSSFNHVSDTCCARICTALLCTILIFLTAVLIRRMVVVKDLPLFVNVSHYLVLFLLFLSIWVVWCQNSIGFCTVPEKIKVRQVFCF